MKFIKVLFQIQMNKNESFYKCFGDSRIIIWKKILLHVCLTLYDEKFQIG